MVTLTVVLACLVTVTSLALCPSAKLLARRQTTVFALVALVRVLRPTLMCRGHHTMAKAGALLGFSQHNGNPGCMFPPRVTMRLGWVWLSGLPAVRRIKSPHTLPANPLVPTLSR